MALSWNFVLLPVLLMGVLGCGRLWNRNEAGVGQRLITRLGFESKDSGEADFNSVGALGRLGIFAAESESPLLRPSHDRVWRPDLALLPSVEFDESRIRIRNVRNCRFRTETDLDVRHYDLEFDLQDIKTVDFIVVPFQSAPMLAHTMFSFGLSDGRYFIISVEARLEQGETYSPAKGSTGQYELMYVVGDEQDLIPLRTEVRDVDVYLYRGNAASELVQDLLIDMLARVNKIYREPEFYDTLMNNCTTNLVSHINRLRPGRIPTDVRIWLPGHSDKLAYDLGLLQVTGSFEDMRARSKINLKSHIHVGDTDFSAKIRQP